MPNKVFTVYRICETIDGRPVSSFEDVLSEDALAALGEKKIEAYGPVRRKDFEARLFVHDPDPRDPGWLELLRTGFQNLEVFRNSANGAVLAVKVRWRRRDRFFAFTFGSGRHLLRQDAIWRNHGLRVALNLIYQGDKESATQGLERLRQVDAKRVEANTLLSRVQANRFATFDAFGLDVQRDLLGAVTGTPVHKGHWGSRVGGSDALHLNLDRGFSELGKLCRDILRTHARKDYQVRFSWVDNVHVVTDPGLAGQLEEALLSSLKGRSGRRFELAPPEIVEWEKIAAFRFKPNSRTENATYGELAIGTWLKVLGSRLASLDIQKLKAWRIEAVDESDQVLYRWPVFRCLDGEIRLNGKLYLLVGGDFFEIARGYLRQLDREVEKIPEWQQKLDDSQAATEGDYNEKIAAASRGRLLLLDKKTVRISDLRTTPIEICDLMTRDGSLIHVKRKLSSSSLSHLFAQGAVSARLLLMSRDFRREAMKTIRAIARRKHLKGFTPFTVDAISPRRLEVVYGIIDHWTKQRGGGRWELVEALPFFSKVNLRHHAENLRSMGYGVFYKRINVIGKAAQKGQAKKKVRAKVKAQRAPVPRIERKAA